MAAHDGGVRVYREATMIGQLEARQQEHAQDATRQSERIYEEGLVAGLIGAAVIAVWFLVLDTVGGRPFHTPTILGRAIFLGGQGLGSPDPEDRAAQDRRRVKGPTPYGVQDEEPDRDHRSPD